MEFNSGFKGLILVMKLETAARNSISFERL